MPLYEYRCADCGKKTTVLTLSVRQAVEPKCRHCGGLRMTKLVSRVAVLRSEESRIDGLTDPSKMGGLDEDDPKAMARWMKSMGKEMGDDLGDDFDEDVDRAMEGEERGGGDAESGGEGGGGGEDDL